MREPRRSQFGGSDSILRDYEEGSICRLRAKDDHIDGARGVAEILESLPEECYGRPAVLLWTEGFGATAAIFTITSFNGQLLHVKHATNRPVRLRHLPISPSPRHPDLGQLLEIDGDPLPKNSYVKIEQVRFCTHQDIRPWGGRKLRSDSYDLLMQYAPPKPENADRRPIRRQSRRQRRYPDAQSPYVASKRPLSVQKLTHGNATTDHRTTSPTYTSLPRPHDIRQKPVDRLREPLLPSYHQTSAPHQSTYRTFRSPNRTSRDLMMPLRRPTPVRNEKPCLRACAVGLLVCVMLLLAIAAAAYNMVA